MQADRQIQDLPVVQDPAAGMHYIHDVIDPSDTRDYIIRALQLCRDRRTGGIGQHRLANWPTKF